jgi:hypothetical protein
MSIGFTPLENLDATVDINSAMETIIGNTCISAKDSLSHNELKQLNEEALAKIV